MNKKITGFIKDYQIEILLFFTFLTAVLFRFYTNTFHLVMTPDYDGYQYVKIARNLAKGVLVKELINWTPLLPSLIAIFSFLPFPLDEIGSVINIVFGAATIFPIYLFVKNILNKEAAFFSVLIYAFNPQIAFVNVQVMSETTYIFVFFLYAWLITEILKDRYSFVLAMLSGIVGGLIYWGRPEGVLIYIALTCLCFIVGKAETKRKLYWLIENLLFFFLTILPYLIFLKKMKGKFVFSGKSSEILYHIKGMMGIPDTGQGFLGTFFYDFSKTFNFLLKNLLVALCIFSDYSYFWGVTLIVLLICGIFTLKKSTLGMTKGIIFFVSMVLPFSAPLIFKVDERYLSPTTSVISVCCGLGLFGIYQMLKLDLRKQSVKLIINITILSLFVFYGFYKIYDRFKKNGELDVMFLQERMYKKSGEWLKAHVPPDATVVSTSTNYLVAYYAGDLKFENVSKNLTEEELIQLVCKSPNRYLIVNYFSVKAYYKNLQFLINPYSQSFKFSKLFDKMYPIYYDNIVGLVIYTCKSGTNEKR